MSAGGSWSEIARANGGDDYAHRFAAQFDNLAAQGKVTLHTTQYPLDAINDAMADLDNGRLQGRGILVPA